MHFITLVIPRKTRTIVIDEQTFACDSTVFDYIYGTWWRCRECGHWRQQTNGEEHK